MLQKPAIPDRRGFPPVGQRRRLQKLHHLAPAAVRHRYLFGCAPFPQVAQQGHHVLGHPNVSGSLPYPVKVSLGQPECFRDLRCGLTPEVQQVGEPVFRHRVDAQSQQEPVEQSVELLAIGKLIARADHGHEWRPLAAGTVVELALVQQGKQGVEDRAVRLEYLVEKGDGGGRQVGFGQPFVTVLFETLDRERAEQLLRHGESGQQALEVDRAREGKVQTARDKTLGCPRWADQEQMLAGQRRQQCKPDGHVALDESGRQ